VKAGWEVKSLGEVCDLVNGKAYKKAELLDKGKYPVLRVGNFFTSDKWFHSDLELEPKKYCHNGDLLYAWSASFGPRIWEGEKSIFHYHIWNVQHPEDLLDRKFLYYYFDWDKEKIKAEQGAGATMIHVSKGSMEQRALPIPPLEEQKQIVAVLDAAFEGLTRAKENAEANLQNARELFASAREEAFSLSQEGWSKKQLGELITIKHGFAFKSEFFQPVGAYVLLTPGNYFEAGGYRDRGDKQKYYIGDIPDGYVLNSGDLLIAMTEQAEGLLGSCILVPEDDRFLHNQRLGLIEAKAGVDWHAPFFAEAFNLSEFRKALTLSSTGIKVRHTSPTKICDESVAVPATFSEQVLVAEKLAALKEKIEELEANYTTKLTDIADLRQSLLQKAFAGELT
jgi:type I restriction enzyme S subunit